MANNPLRVAILAGVPILAGLPGIQGQELRLVERIKADRRFQLVAVLRTDATAPDPGNRRGGRKTCAGFLFTLLTTAEQRLRAVDRPAGHPDLSTILTGVETIAIACPEGGNFSDADCQRIRSLDLDVVLDQGEHPAARSLANAARFGTWSLIYADTSAIRGQPPGFWEVYAGLGVTGVTLLQFAPDPADIKVIARAFYPTRKTYSSNMEFLRENATELVLRELRKVQRARRLAALPASDQSAVVYPAPTTFQIVSYASHLGMAMLNAARRKIAGKFGVAMDRWTLLVGTGQYENAVWSEAVETRPPPGEYWADPFLFRRDGEVDTHVFFEVFDYATGKGKISVGRVSDRKINYLGDALDTGYHLSYPFVFQYDDHVWMIPESHETRRLELWKCVEYPLKWKLEKTVMEGQNIVDSSICEHDGAWWLFTNQSGKNTNDHNSELYVYRIDSPMMNEIIPHEANPVVIDAKRARNGGRMHLRDGFLMRPAQNNAFRYGYGLGVYRITALTLDTYEEEPAFSIEPTFRSDITACHHLDSNGEIFVFDARLKFG